MEGRDEEGDQQSGDVVGLAIWQQQEAANAQHTHHSPKPEGGPEAAPRELGHDGAFDAFHAEHADMMASRRSHHQKQEGGQYFKGMDVPKDVSQQPGETPPKIQGQSKGMQPGWI